jgi:GntR family transcriptional regulator
MRMVGRYPAAAGAADEVRAWAAEDPTTIRRDSAIPLHFQLRQVILGMIERGEVRVGEPLPTERDLAARYGVSLAPVRQAVLDLVREGLLYRVSGQGTFLRERPNLERVSVLSSFSDSMRARGFDVAIEILRHEAVRPPAQVADALGSEKRRVLCFERVAVVNGEPLGLLTSFLPLHTFPGLIIDGRAEGSLYRALEDQFGVVPVHAEMVMELAPCSTSQSGLLSVPVGSPLLFSEGTTFDGDDAPMEYFRVFYRPDRIRIRLDTSRSAEDVVRLAQSGRRRGKGQTEAETQPSSGSGAQGNRSTPSSHGRTTEEISSGQKKSR